MKPCNNMLFVWGRGLFLVGFLGLGLGFFCLFVLKLVLIQKVLFTRTLLTGVELKTVVFTYEYVCAEVSANWLAMSVRSRLF